MFWGVGVAGLLGVVVWVQRSPGSAPLGRAFGILALFGLVFLLTLLMVWWTGGRTAVALDEEGLRYQPLHTFSPRRISYRTIHFCGPRQGTQSLRLLYESRPGELREFFLNLAVIQGRNEFLDLLGERLEAAGLEPVPEERQSWRRPGFELDGAPT